MGNTINDAMTKSYSNGKSNKPIGDVPKSNYTGERKENPIKPTSITTQSNYTGKRNENEIKPMGNIPQISYTGEYKKISTKPRENINNPYQKMKRKNIPISTFEGEKYQEYPNVLENSSSSSPNDKVTNEGLNKNTEDMVNAEINTDIASETPFSFAEIIKQNYYIKAVIAQEVLYIYSELGGNFEPYSKQKFTSFLFKVFTEPQYRKKLKSNFTKEIFHFLVNEPELQVSLEDFNSADEYLLNIKNGVINIKELKLLPHSPDYMFTYTLQVNFPDEYKKPKKFMSVLEKCFDSEEDRELCLESLAYILSNNTSAKTIWFFVGKANSGKSMLLRLISHIIGKKYVASIPLNRLEGRFELSSAINCRANIVAEVANLKLKEVKTLKMISGGDQIIIDAKHEAPYFATLKLKFLLAGNHLPRLESSVAKDDGIKSRFKFLYLANSLDESERIDEYDKVIYEQEGDNIFYLLMKRLKKFYERGCKFKETETSKIISSLFCDKIKKDIERFIDKYCLIESDAMVATNELYATYREFCSTSGLSSTTQKQFLEYIQGLPCSPIKTRSRIDGSENAVSVIRGIALR